MNFDHENIRIRHIRERLSQAGEHARQRFPHDLTLPSFRSAPLAARNVLNQFPDAQSVLVMRDVCLKPICELILHEGRTLLIPIPDGGPVLRFPARPTPNGIHARQVLKINPPPPGTTIYNGQVDLIIVGCLAYDTTGLFSYETERTARIMECLYDGTSITPDVSGRTPVLCMAADEQQVEGWPDDARAQYAAHAVVTPTRVIMLNSTECV